MLRVLVVEDEQQNIDMYLDILEQLGLEATIARTRSEGLERIAKQQFDVVIPDQRLQGPSGPEDGVSILRDAQLKGAKVFVITAYANDDTIKRAFELGAYDFIEKGKHLRTLLTAKLDQVRELVRARSRDLPEGQQRIEALFARLDEGPAIAKGKRLEDLLLMLMTSVPGFKEGWKHLHTPGEELDIVIRNEASDPFWAKQPSYILAEAKNWSKPVGTAEIAWFADKLRGRPDARLGYFFAPRGFSEPVEEMVRTYRREGLQLVLVDEGALSELVDSHDRNQRLKDLHTRWAVGR